MVLVLLAVTALGGTYLRAARETDVGRIRGGLGPPAPPHTSMREAEEAVDVDMLRGAGKGAPSGEDAATVPLPASSEDGARDGAGGAAPRVACQDRQGHSVDWVFVEDTAMLDHYD